MDYVPDEGGGQEAALTVIIKQFIICSIQEEDPDSCLECSQEFNPHHLPCEMVNSLKLMLVHLVHRGRPQGVHHHDGEPEEGGDGSGVHQNTHNGQELIIRLIEV